MTLARRLNIWYAGVVLVTLGLGAATAEVLATHLASRRRTSLIERVESEVRSVYSVGGTDAAADVEIPGIDIRLQDDDGRPLVGSLPHVEGDRVEVRRRIAEGVWLVTAIPDRDVFQTRRDARVALAGGGLAVLLLAMGGGLWATRRALRPVSHVADTARHIIETGDASARVPTPGTGDELDEMVALFNALLDTEQHRVEQMRSSLDSIGHDLRTPMTRIRAAAELALAGREVGALEEALETALEESAASESLLTSLLDLTRAEAGMMPLDARPVNAAQLLERARTLYEQVADERGVQITCTASPTHPPLSADRTRVEQALANLVDNAVKFSPPGGTVQLTLVEGEASLGLAVTDEGPGIPPEDHARVFERLYRGDRSRNTPGAGLGLAMVQAIAQAHGGHVELRSAPGDGSTFTLWLPTGTEDPAGTAS